MTVLSIDPGMSGAVVLYTANPERPEQGVLDVRRDFKDLEDIAIAVGHLAPQAQQAVIELVHAMPGQGVCSMFSFGKSTGVALGALVSAGFRFPREHVKPIFEVSPQKWQNWIRTFSGWGGEFDSRAIALKLNPAFAPYLKRKLDHNTADAILMAVWRIGTYSV